MIQVRVLGGVLVETWRSGLTHPLARRATPSRGSAGSNPAVSALEGDPAWRGNGLENRQVRKGRGSIPPPSATVTMAAVPRHSRPPRGALLSLRQTRGVPRRRAAQRALRRGCNFGGGMPWSATSGRTSPLPPNWASIRRAVLERDGHRCMAMRGDTGERCDWPANQVDHMDEPDDHRLHMLQSLCAYHHARKTAAQGGRARPKKVEPKHPGYR